MHKMNGPWAGWAPVAVGVALAVGLAMTGNARAKNIFDDDWTPPARPTSQPSTVPVPSQPPPAQPAAPRPKEPAELKASPVASDSTAGPGSGGATIPRAIPTAQEQASVRKLFKEVYSHELADPSANGKTALAHRLITDAANTKDAPIDQFVMLTGARQAAVDAGDVELALGADGELCKSFLIDVRKSRLELLTRLSMTVRTPSDCVMLGKAALGQADDAAAQGEYDIARQYAEAAVAGAKRCENGALLGQTTARAASLGTLAMAYAQLDKPLAILQQKPDDPEANLAVGRFYCLKAGQWSTGLKYLAAGSDAKLSAAAKADLQGADPLSIAEQWQALADRENPADKRYLRLRAAQWYRDGLGTLKGLLKAKAERELATLDAGPFRAEAKELSFANSQSAETILASGVGVAALGSIDGRFQGDGERAGVLLLDDGKWSSECISHQGDLRCSVIVYPRVDGLNLDAEIKEYQWKRGEPKVKMIQRSEGFCFLSEVAGHFEGGGERVGVTIGDDGFWYLDCDTHQALFARAISVKPRGSRVFSTDVRVRFSHF